MKAHEVINSPDKWTQGTYARTIEGIEVYTRDQNAVCFCAIGAITKAYATANNERFNAFKKLQAKLVEELGEDIDIPEWNDDPERTWEEVYNKLKELDI